MNRINSLAELSKVKEAACKALTLKDGQTVLAVGAATCGIAAGAKDVMDALSKAITEKRLEDVSVTGTGCLGFCFAEPLVEVRQANKEPIRYANVDEQLAKQIVEQHVAQGILIEKSVLGMGV